MNCRILGLLLLGGACSSSRLPGSVDTSRDLRDVVADEILAEHPGRARMLGLHEYDSRISDFSEKAITSRIARLRARLPELEAQARQTTSQDENHDYRMLTRDLALELFELEELESWRRVPQFYEEIFSVDAYLDRDYLPLHERARRLLAHERAALLQVPNIRANLRGPFSRPIVETAIKIFGGYAEYLRQDVPAALAGVGDPAWAAEFAAVNEQFARAAEGVALFLKDELPKADMTSHVLGAARYAKLLQLQEGITAPLAEFKRQGEVDLDSNRTKFEALAPSVTQHKPKKDKLLDRAREMMEDSKAFIIEKKIATIPPSDGCVVKESPPYMRWNSAFLNPAGPFEAKSNAFYYMTMPDPAWSDAEQEAYLMGEGTLLATTVHEVFPGHFLQGLWERKAPTRVQRIMSSYSFVEGWAHYTEEMMLDEGFHGQEPEMRLGQLQDALLRNCRYVASIGIHTEGMTLEAAADLFEHACHQDRATAREQAVRGTFDPGYFAYTLGKIQIRALRDRAKKALGKRFSLGAFHDALLSHGTPPIPWIEDRVLREIGAVP